MKTLFKNGQTGLCDSGVTPVRKSRVLQYPGIYPESNPSRKQSLSLESDHYFSSFILFVVWRTYVELILFIGLIFKQRGKVFTNNSPTTNNLYTVPG